MAELVSHHPTQENIYTSQGCSVSLGILCNACCEYFNVPDLHKPPGQMCSHNEGGCAIHNKTNQPRICREYHCNREVRVLRNPLIIDTVIREAAFQRIKGLLKISAKNGKISQERSLELIEYWEIMKNTVYEQNQFEEE